MDFWISRQMQIGIEHGCVLGWCQLDPEAVESELQRFIGDSPEVHVAPHEGAQPGIFELLCSPQHANGLRIYCQALERDHHRVYIEERTVGIKHECLRSGQTLYLGDLGAPFDLNTPFH
jgi:hypothetical protein